VTSLPDDPVEVLVVRARRSRRKGDVRGALVLLRRACALDEWRARTYTLLGVEAGRQGQVEEATRALHQARWLRLRAGETARVAVTARLEAALRTAA
jgi:Flp pilus assembly protein TadD